MATNPTDVVEEYLVKSLEEGRFLTTTDLNERDDIGFGEGPVYTHFGSIDDLQFSATVEAGVWTEKDWESVCEQYDVDPDALFDRRV